MPVIKRYTNRKLYDTDSKQYITLEGVAELIRQGLDVQVIEHESGSDITPLVSAQIILAQERKASGWLPQSLLKNLVRAGSDTLNHLRQSLTPGAEFAVQVDAEIERRVNALLAKGELKESEGQLILNKLLGAVQHPKTRRQAKADLARTLRKQHIPSRREFEKLKRRVEALNSELDHLALAESHKTG